MGDNFAQLQWDKKPGYILENIIHPSNIGKVKKNFSKRAIVWLLSKNPHSIPEIADHYGIAPELVQYLISELIARKRVVKLGRSNRYQATEQIEEGKKHT